MNPMPPRLTQPLRDLLVPQDNVVALWQLPGPERRAARRAARLRQWRRLSPQVILASPTAPTASQLAWAAVLHCGPKARLSGRTALILHGWRGDLTTPHDVVVPRAVRPRPAPDLVRVRRVAEPSGPAALPARTSPHLAALHAAAWAPSDRQAMYTMISTLQQRLTSPNRLRETLEHLPTLRRRRLISSVITEFADGIQSLNELDFAAMCREFGVPEPFRQRRVLDSNGRLRAIDAYFRTASGATIRVEIEGMQHLDPEQYFADITRHNDLAFASPATSVRITTWHLRHEPEPFMRDLRRAVLEG